MADQQLYRVECGVRYEHIEPLLSGAINQDLILGRWDDLVRLAASLKMGWATASLLVSKLQSHRRLNALMRALQEYGRLIKSILIVRCLDSPEYRKRIGIQLNKASRCTIFGGSYSSQTRARSAARSMRMRQSRRSA